MIDIKLSEQKAYVNLLLLSSLLLPLLSNFFLLVWTIFFGNSIEKRSAAFTAHIRRKESSNGPKKYKGKDVPVLFYMS